MMKRQIIGVLGSIFTALCCIGTPALLAFLVSIGVGFVIHDLILLPLLVVLLAFSVWSIHRSRATHRQRGPFVLAVVSSIVIVATVWFSPATVLLGLLGLIAASGWDIYLHKRCGKSVATSVGSSSDSL